MDGMYQDEISQAQIHALVANVFPNCTTRLGYVTEHETLARKRIHLPTESPLAFLFLNMSLHLLSVKSFGTRTDTFFFILARVFLHNSQLYIASLDSWKDPPMLNVTKCVVGCTAAIIAPGV